MSDKFKTAEIKGRKFLIKKFDARTGSFMLIKIAGLLAPVFTSQSLINKIKISGKVNPSASDISGILSILSGISEEEFEQIQTKCLKVCFEDLPGAPACVLNNNGSFGVIGLEEDTMTVMALTAHVLIHNLTGFFEESPLASIIGAALNTPQQDAKM